MKAKLVYLTAILLTLSLFPSPSLATSQPMAASASPRTVHERTDFKFLSPGGRLPDDHSREQLKNDTHEFFIEAPAELPPIARTLRAGESILIEYPNARSLVSRLSSACTQSVTAAKPSKRRGRVSGSVEFVRTKGCYGNSSGYGRHFFRNRVGLWADGNGSKIPKLHPGIRLHISWWTKCRGTRSTNWRTQGAMRDTQNSSAITNSAPAKLRCTA